MFPKEDSPDLRTPVPGPQSTAWVDILARHESPGVTARRARQGESRGIGRDPIVWARAQGAWVWDVDDNRYLDLTGAFGVALIGHAHPEVVKAVQQQAATLMHAMGDVYPNPPRIELMEMLAHMAPGNLSQSILGSDGADAVEAALKTAVLKSGRSGVLAFDGSYHGLSYGTLAATSYREGFSRPFREQLAQHVVHMPYGGAIDALAATVKKPTPGGQEIGAILVEPILGRGGKVVPPDDWLRGLRKLADQEGLVLIFDEIYTGLGRTGRWWAGDHADVIPDIICVGKALGAGMPVSACIAKPEVMGAWTQSEGEAIHTCTFLGHPVAAAAALASLQTLKDMDAPKMARRIEAAVRSEFGDRVRGRGAMLGIETRSSEAAAKAMGWLLKAGVLVLPCGVDGDILGLTPPLCLTDGQLDRALETIRHALEYVESCHSVRDD